MGFMEGEVKNFISVWLSIISCLCYCYFISSRIPIGKYRLISLLPIFSLFTILPLSLSSTLLTAITTFFITWLANFKLLLFSFGQGPLSWDPPKSLPVFISIACLPIKIKQNKPNPNSNSSQITKKLPLNLATETLVFGVLMGGLYDYKNHLHPIIVLVLYCIESFLLIDVLVAYSNALIRALVGLELEQPSDEPYLATSLQDFWGKRWNLMVTNLLRHTVYRPVRSALAGILGSTWAPLPAVLATFVVSGLMHELLFCYITRAGPTWETSSFFVLHGVCLVVELGVKRAVADTWRLHWALARLLTVGFVVVTSFWLFFPPLIGGGADVKVIEEFGVFVDFLKTSLKLKLSVG